MLDDLRELARLYGVETSYHDAMGRHVEASPESLLAVLRALGAPLESEDDVAEALAERRQELDERVIEPVFVAWDGRPPEMLLRFGSDSWRDSAGRSGKLERGALGVPAQDWMVMRASVLNDLGREGREMTGVAGDSSETLYFKRLRA